MAVDDFAIRTGALPLFNIRAAGLTQPSLMQTIMDHESTDPVERGGAAADVFRVLCLCAEWCGTCREYRPGFLALAAQFPNVRFGWIDIEDRADDMGDLDIENFPTLLVLRGERVLFFGTMLPHVGHLQRTIEVFVAQGEDESLAYANSDNERRSWQNNADLRHLGGLDL